MAGVGEKPDTAEDIPGDLPGVGEAVVPVVSAGALGRTMGTGGGPRRTEDAFPLVASFLLLRASAAADKAPVRGTLAVCTPVL